MANTERVPVVVSEDYSEIAKLVECSRRFDMCEDGGLRLEGERNETGEAVRLVLQLPELAQVIHALLERLDVAVQHPASAASSHLVPGAMHLEPLGGCFFPAA